MAQLSPNRTADLEDDSEGLARNDPKMRLASSPLLSPVEQKKNAPPLSLSTSGAEDPVWMDLVSPDQAQLEEVRQKLGVPSEALTHCLLPAHTNKVIPIDSTLFLATFVGVFSPRRGFALRTLKLCVGRGFLLTVHGRVSRTLRTPSLRLPGQPWAGAQSTGHLLRTILEGTIQSYETVSAELKKRFREMSLNPRPSRGERLLRQQLQTKGRRFVSFLRRQRAFLQDVKRTGDRFFTADDHTRLQWLTERVGVLERIIGEVMQVPGEGKSVMEQEVVVILTETEKKTALVGGRFSCQHFSQVDLAGAVFQEADLEGAKFVRVDLRGARFCRANLRGAMFSLCDLQGVDVTEACLEGANFRTSFGLSPAMWRYIRAHGGVV